MNKKKYIYLFWQRFGKEAILAGSVCMLPQTHGITLEISAKGMAGERDGKYPLMILTDCGERSCGWINLCNGAIDEKRYLSGGGNEQNVSDSSVYLENISGICIRFGRQSRLAGFVKKAEKPMHFSRIHPLGDGREFFMIKPEDCHILLNREPHLEHNSFLLHGYYNYRHLILGPCGTGTQQMRCKAFLGVPGNFYSKEKLVAAMFGFDDFWCEGITEIGKFGYYVRQVRIEQENCEHTCDIFAGKV